MLIAAVAVVGVLIGTGDEEERPKRYTAELPRGFGPYRLAGEGESLWARFGKRDNLDPSKGIAHASYLGREGGRKSFAISLDLHPVADDSDPVEDEVVSELLGTRVESGRAKRYRPGPIGGKLRCVEYEVARTTSSRCVWGDGRATVTAQPVVTSGPRPTPGKTAAEVRAFLAELRIRAVR
ncbi:hypothetical protein [Streptomyces albiaxialis]|uniref:hypothetical protein n=1 Tax=Streptomyces albiaxialis TaxID=329523 RepID=UPI0031D0F399